MDQPIGTSPRIVGCPHGGSGLTGLQKALEKRSDPARAEFTEGRFGRLFSRDHKHFQIGPRDKTKLDRLAKTMNEGTSKKKAGDSVIPAGFTFLGQFIDHDVTLDPISKLEEDNSSESSFRNFRTPNLDLDCVYGAGPDATPHLYYLDSKGEIILGRNTRGDDDIQRNRFGQALLGDPRNDENLFVNHIQIAFIKLHNAILERAENDFEDAQASTVWCYHQLIIEDFLPRLVGKELVAELAKKGPTFFVPSDRPKGSFPFIPIEFSVAAYRYGHSQVRSNYHVNAKALDKHVFELGGFQQARDSVDMRYQFEIPRHEKLCQRSRKIDRKLPGILFEMPERIGGDEPSLPSRNLRRGASFGLPSGQSVARMIGEKISGTPVLRPDAATRDAKLKETPLWYYILQEAESTMDGNRLGPVGGRIVGEVLWGLMQRNPSSATHKKRAAHIKKFHRGRFTMAELLRFVGMA